MKTIKSPRSGQDEDMIYLERIVLDDSLGDPESVAEIVAYVGSSEYDDKYAGARVDFVDWWKHDIHVNGKHLYAAYHMPFENKKRCQSTLVICSSRQILNAALHQFKKELIG